MLPVFGVGRVALVLQSIRPGVLMSLGDWLWSNTREVG